MAEMTWLLDDDEDTDAREYGLGPSLCRWTCLT
jgi:hypothetical protein